MCDDITADCLGELWRAREPRVLVRLEFVDGRVGEVQAVMEIRILRDPRSGLDDAWDGYRLDAVTTEEPGKVTDCMMARTGPGQ